MGRDKKHSEILHFYNKQLEQSVTRTAINIKLMQENEQKCTILIVHFCLKTTAGVLDDIVAAYNDT